MDFQRHGLIKKFILNRWLNDFELQHQLRQDEPKPDKPWGLRTVIKMNSTYLECVDKFFGEKGILSAVGLTGAGAFIIGFLSFVSITIGRWSSRTPEMHSENINFLIFDFVLCSGAVIFSWWFLLRHELFRRTHYPIRFNRKTRMVYVTRLDGTVMAESWDKLFFTEGDCNGRYGELRDIRGHRLAKDGRTVLETFALPHYSYVSAPYRFVVWEFIRRYMEDGPEELMRRVPMVNDVTDRRECFFAGCGHQYSSMESNVGSTFALLLSPVVLWFAIGRWAAMLTCKIPRWPAEVEAQCQIDPDDPYVIDRDHPPKIVDTFGNEDFLTDEQKMQMRDRRIQAIHKANEEYQRRRRGE
jgi:hypothetical protein